MNKKNDTSGSETKKKQRKSLSETDVRILFTDSGPSLEEILTDFFIRLKQD